MYSYERIAARYGLKLGEKFNIIEGQHSFSSPYEFREDGIYNKYDEKVMSPILDLTAGNFKKVSDDKWEYMEQ